METQMPPNYYQQPFPGFQPPLPNATAVLVLGILSIVLSCCFGIIGVIVGIIALVLGGKANLLFMQNPAVFSLSSYNNMKAGKICAIIGLIMSALVMIYYLVMLVLFGAFSAVPWEMNTTI